MFTAATGLAILHVLDDAFIGAEAQLNRIWAERAPGRVQLWELPEGKHTGALDEAPEEYERRVIGFFGRRLLGSL